MRVLKLTPFLLGFLIICMRWVPTTTTPSQINANPVLTQDIVDPQVGGILDRACQDCHSDRTRWPWYSRVAPVSWIVGRDVVRGRAKLNFSEWAASPPSANERMEVCDAVSNGSMPLRVYTIIHRNARLSKQDINWICDWAAAATIQASAGQIGSPYAKTEILTRFNDNSFDSKGSR